MNGVIFCEYVARIQRIRFALLFWAWYCHRGVSHPVQRRQESCNCQATYLGHVRDSAMSSVFPKDEESTQKTLHRYFSNKTW
jgi:hypothetical protein